MNARASHTTRRLAGVFAVVAGMVLIGWLFTGRPWQRELWVTTTMDAFVGARPGTAALGVSGGRIKLVVGITPAPWPEEAHAIAAAVRHGKRVHVTVRTNEEAIRFDTDGMTPDGELRIVCASAQEAKRLAQALRLL